jgi:hypothetical protein
VHLDLQGVEDRAALRGAGRRRPQGELPAHLGDVLRLGQGGLGDRRLSVELRELAALRLFLGGQLGQAGLGGVSARYTGAVSARYTTPLPPVRVWV